MGTVADDIVNRVAEGIHQRFDKASADSQVDPAWIADAMLSAIPDSHPFDRLGPFYDTAGLCQWLGVSRQAIHQRIKNHQLLAPTTADGQRVYPAWQFLPTGAVLLGLPALLAVVLTGTDDWTAAIWLTTPSERLGGKSAIETLRQANSADPHNGDLDAVLAVARSDVDRWTQ